MPLTLNVGLSKKVGEPNYGSRGASVNLELELESMLANNPSKLQQRIRELFVLVRSAVQEELNSEPVPHSGNGNSHNNGNGNGHNHSHAGNGGSSGRRATQSQIRALHAIANRQRLDLASLLNAQFQVSRPDDLSLKEASQMIDQLNGDEAGVGAGGQR